MGKFTLDASGAKSLGDGVGSIFKALAMAPNIRTQAEQDAALKGSQIYSRTMLGNKSGAQAENIMDLMNLRRGEIKRLDEDQNVTPYERYANSLFKLTGDDNAANLARAAELGQTMQNRDAVIADPSRALQIGQAWAATSGKMPFSNSGADGYALNALTGDNIEANPAVAQLYKQLTTAKTNAQNASASNSNSHARLADINSSLKQLEYDNAVGGTGGKPLTNSQKRENQAIDNARENVNTFRPEDVNAVLDTPESMMTAYQKNIFAVIRQAQKTKFGEDATPVDVSQNLGLDPQVMDTVSKLLEKPLTTKKGMWGFQEEGPMTGSDIDRLVKKEVPGVGNYASRYVDAARRGGDKKPVAPVADPTISHAFVKDQADRVRQAFKDGKMPREEALRRLQQLGYD